MLVHGDAAGVGWITQIEILPSSPWVVFGPLSRFGDTEALPELPLVLLARISFTSDDLHPERFDSLMDAERPSLSVDGIGIRPIACAG